MAQEIGDPVAGYALRPPDGWETAQQEGRILLAPPEGGAVILAIPHAASDPEELGPLFQQGWTEPGLELAPAGSPERRDDGSVALELTGRADGEEARGSLLVLFGPHGGGLILIGAARAGDSEDPAAVVSAVADTVRFSEPETAKLLEGWDRLLRGKKLSYFYSYSSGPAGEGVSLGGGIQERHELVLHEDGGFEQEGEFVASLGEAGGATKEVWPPGGDWRLLAAAGQALVELQGEGETTEYVLSQEGDEVFLNGRHYFVTEP
jgi:hypothetical protein